MNGHTYGTNTLNVTRHVPTTVQSELWPVNGNVRNGSNARLQEWVERRHKGYVRVQSEGWANKRRPGG